MVERKDLDRDQPRSENRTEATKSADGGRRRFVMASLAAAPVILTLSSRPAWASRCSISGMMSGNTSAPDEAICVGLTPGFWRNMNGLPLWGCGVTTGGLFKDLFPGINPAVFPFVPNPDPPGGMTNIQAIEENNQDPAPLPPSQPDRNVKDAKLETPYPPALWAHMVAGMLNACFFETNSSFDYGYTFLEMLDFITDGFNSSPSQLLLDLTSLNERGVPSGPGS